MTEAADGGLAATGTDRRVRFSAAPARMWDSAGPGGQEHTAAVAAHVRGGRLALTPDAAMLASPGTRFPLYIDPTWNPLFGRGAKQHYDEVQQGCPTGTHLDSTDPNYTRLGVGLQDFSGCIGIERAYYQPAARPGSSASSRPGSRATRSWAVAPDPAGRARSPDSTATCWRCRGSARSSWTRACRTWSDRAP